MNKDSKDETTAHILRVRELLHIVQNKLEERGFAHDLSKLQSPEKEGFDEVTGALRGLTYGSDEYKAQLERLKPILAHHYAHNSHHPEHYSNGVDGMTLLDLVEMFCDWKAATERHADGNIEKSIRHNAVRFNLSPQLASILENTRKEMGW
jgi:hypothetical protein